ncbi:fatty acid desaturase family protein [Hoeflea poritis]|uniref:Fatty acid desaturase family protein n=1 Tax=Hoeflea poritis TaxID=2993659 RepID=A0ABT4VHE6_9HYPH|nr:fatty acid desaturase family protein [Hoeflea poritis]MDA4844105.1 fatty acid desaturase family protein [Hoeflea poritis]
MTGQRTKEVQSPVSNHWEFLASLSPQEKKRLTEKSDARGIVALALHTGTIVALAVLIAAKVPFWPLLMVPQGIAIVFLFTTLHETIHRTAFATPWINDIVARICGFLILLPAEWFRYFHFAHHRHTQDPERDPELAHPKPETVVQYIIHVSGLPVWKSQIATLIRHAVRGTRDDFVPQAARPAITREARRMLAAYVVLAAISAAAGSTLLLFVWIIPAILGQPFLRLYLLAEHGRCAFVANMFENSRTTFTNLLVRRLAWNMPYHAEHHAFPGVPFHRLPEFHRLTKSYLRETEDGYVRFTGRYARSLSG